MVINVHTKDREYPVYVERGVLKRAKELIGREGHVFIVSDDGVDEKWLACLKAQYPDAPVHLFPNGEASKNLKVWSEILEDMLDHNVSRNDTVIALGGGVVGDMAGFAAASYMRGIHYVNIPTTTLSQIDSSIGGKTAVDLSGRKNCVGAFWQPDMVLVDPDTLSTLSRRHFHNGLAEAVKEGLIRDEGLFELFESDSWQDHLDEIIERSLIIKRDVVEKDERESGERKLLNFGHTFGHAYETYYGLDGYYHGECVAMGMMAVLENEEIRTRLKAVLKRLDLPYENDADPKETAKLVRNDKKADHDKITIVQVSQIGHGFLEEWTMADVERKLGL
jgi:3-dehydroquinate synthase